MIGTGACMHRSPPVHTCPMLPHAWHAQQPHSQCVAYRVCTRAGQGSAESTPIAARAQPAARLLDKLHTLLLQRRSQALLGRRLRLGARLPHLGDCFLIVQAWRILGKEILQDDKAALRHHMPCAATRMACMAVPRCRTLSLQNQARAVQPTAARAQQAARLLVRLCALTRQRRRQALLGCCLHRSARLRACLQHLSALPQSPAHATK
jgi:hypothetical protein